jgi:hypothetical protein
VATAPHVACPQRAAILGFETNGKLPMRIPALLETVRGYELNAWYAIFAPAGLPAAAVRQYRALYVSALREIT